MKRFFLKVDLYVGNQGGILEKILRICYIKECERDMCEKDRGNQKNERKETKEE